MDIEKILSPTAIVALIGVISTIVAGYIGRNQRRAQVEDTEASAADKLTVGYSRLVQSWEVRLASVQADVAQMREERKIDREEIRRLTLQEAKQAAQIEILMEEIEELRGQKDALVEEREALWSRLGTVEKDREKLKARVKELELMLGVTNGDDDSLDEKEDDA